MPKTFFKQLFSLGDRIKLIGQGNVSKFVYKVVHCGDDSDGKFSNIIKALAGITFTGTLIAIIESYSNTQKMGIVGASVNQNNELFLIGHCLEAGKAVPEENIEQKNIKIIDPKNTDEIDKWLLYSNKGTNILDISPTIISDFNKADNFFISDKERISNNFVQAGIWVITDNLTFFEVRRYLFGDMEFFNEQHLEVILILIKHLIESGADIKNTTLLKDTLVFIGIDHANNQYLPNSIKELWGYRYGLNIILENKKIKVSIKDILEIIIG